MTTLLQQFVAQRAARQKKPITNDSQPVTRAEFSTLVQAVHGLIEDFAAATDPQKMQGAISEALNSALKEAPGSTAPRQPDRGRYLLPSDDDDAQPLGNAAPAARYALPEGD
jgi:hypothetical protein